MSKELVKAIDSRLEEVYASDSYENHIIEKFDVPEYAFWKEKVFNGALLNDKKIESESLGQNMCYTAFCTFKNSCERITIFDFFYIQKSILGDYVTFYIKSRVSVKHEDSKIIYPMTLFLSPLGDYQKIFDEAWKFIKSIYPETKYVPFYILQKKNERYRDFDKSFPDFPNYYTLLFGYEGNILSNRALGNKYYRPDKEDSKGLGLLL